MPTKFDLVVIGAGPAGEGAAMRAAKAGLETAMVDEKAMVGGNCAHLGTIPSKALRHAVKQIITFNTDALFRDIGEPRTFSFPKVLKRAESVIAKQVKLRTTFYSRNEIKLYHGQARFTDSNTLEVVKSDGSIETLIADKFVIATGSRPYRPDDVDFSHRQIYDSDTVLKLQHTPRKIVIYGAGVIGCEYASIFCGLGVRVELINTRDRLLDFLDYEISDSLSYHLRDIGVLIRNGEEYEDVIGRESDVVVKLKSGKIVRGDTFLWCNGRTGNTDLLNLDAIGLLANHRGQLEVNDRYQTVASHVYAAGDVIGWPSLASAAYDQGRSTGAGVAGLEDFYLVEDVPTGIYTLPEISSLGKTEQELTQERVPYEVGQAAFKTVARAQITGETVGVLKILFHRETLQILGIHCFGDQASEIIHIGQAIMNQPGEANSIEYFVNTTFNYPTMAEAYRVAALNGLYRVSSY
ncbi:Si-specific NAD(P)(+) transhydrogenase [Ketobacter sp. MCCC 1A13808]|uniref:Si-specific NAD(P)(+) transhydrogenase n=1 Tax=Ketobacter sp. MCCC 1A13808 TaxID=2602738 RepID=UPI0012EC4336|nr:Si-specific NAD(P)(+) transhydrogenase [Ketobacter sp. MCCC 1A13808]MVF10715.1 Si-specific NAD(P)(+) transhydrogenase [Ketobacter sp. MCCC 1A13808]